MTDARPLSLPENASLPTRIRTGLRALEVLEDDAGDPVAGPLLNACLDGGVYEALGRTLRQSEPGRALLDERPGLQGSTLDLQQLAALPPGTLGHAFARYFEDNRIQPFESPFEVRNDVDYLSRRYRETHDLLHVVTGYGTDVVGEMELQAYALGNLGIRTAVLILLFSTRMQRRTPGFRFGPYARKLLAAYRRGKRSPRFIDFRFERHWEAPLAEVSARLCAPRAA